MSPLSRLFGYSRRYSARFGVALTAMLLYAGASAGVAFLIKPIIDEGLQPGRPGAQLPVDNLIFWSAAILAAYLVKGFGGTSPAT